MKKVMFALVALVFGVVANAASVSWTAVAVNPVNSTDDITKYTAYIIDNSAYALSGVSQSTLKDAIGAAAYSTALAKTSSTATTGKLPTGVSFTDGTANEASASYYMIVVDDGMAHYFTSDVKTAKATSAGKLTMGFGSLASQSAAGAWKDATPGTPEPTSGLLLLVGGAMLALRRRRA